MQEEKIRVSSDRVPKSFGTSAPPDSDQDLSVKVYAHVDVNDIRDRVTYKTRKGLADTIRPDADFIRQARLGVARNHVDRVANTVGLTDVEIARILNISKENLHNKRDNERLDTASSERLLLLERLINHGLSVFDGRADLLNQWLHTPFAELAYRAGGDLPPEPFSIRDAGSFTRPEYESQTVQKSVREAPAPQTPLEIMDTVVGFSLADDVLGRIEWGIVG